MEENLGKPPTTGEEVFKPEVPVTSISHTTSQKPIHVHAQLLVHAQAQSHVQQPAQRTISHSQPIYTESVADFGVIQGVKIHDTVTSSQPRTSNSDGIDIASAHSCIQTSGAHTYSNGGKDMLNHIPSVRASSEETPYVRHTYANSSLHAYGSNTLTEHPMTHTAADVFRRVNASTRHTHAHTTGEMSHNRAEAINSNYAYNEVPIETSHRAENNVISGSSVLEKVLPVHDIAFPAAYTARDSVNGRIDADTVVRSGVVAHESIPHVSHTQSTHNGPVTHDSSHNTVLTHRNSSDVTHESIRSTLRRLLQKQTALENKLASVTGDVTMGQIATVKAHLIDQIRYFDTISDTLDADKLPRHSKQSDVHEHTQHTHADARNANSATTQHTHDSTRTHRSGSTAAKKHSVQSTSTAHERGAVPQEEGVDGLGFDKRVSVQKLLKGVERLQHAHTRKYRQREHVNHRIHAHETPAVEGETTECTTSESESDNDRRVGPSGYVRTGRGRLNPGSEKISDLTPHDLAVADSNECRHVSRNRRFFRRRAALAWRWSWLELRIAQVGTHIGTLTEIKTRTRNNNQVQIIPYTRQADKGCEHAGRQPLEHTHTHIHTLAHASTHTHASGLNGHRLGLGGQAQVGDMGYAQTQQPQQQIQQHTHSTQNATDDQGEHGTHTTETPPMATLNHPPQNARPKPSGDGPVQGKKRRGKQPSAYKDRSTHPKTCARLREYVLPTPRLLWAENTVGVKGRPEILVNVMGRNRLARQISALDTSYHPVLSRVVEAAPFLRCSTLHPAPALPLASSWRGQRDSEAAANANLSKKQVSKVHSGNQTKSGSISARSSTTSIKKKPISRTSSANKVSRKRSDGKKRDKAGLQRKRTKSASNLTSVDAKKKGTEETDSTASVLGKGTRRTSSHSNVFKRHKVYDIDNVVIPVTAGMVTRVQAIEFQEIETPSWRPSTESIQTNDPNAAPQEHYSSEDTSDEAYEKRHNARQKIETSRFEAFMKNLHQPRRRRSSHTRKDSQSEKQITATSVDHENEEYMGAPVTSTLNGAKEPTGDDTVVSTVHVDGAKSDSGQITSTSSAKTNSERLRNDACIVRLPLISGGARNSVSIEGTTVGAISSALKEKEKDRQDDTKVVQVKMQQQQLQLQLQQQQHTKKRDRPCWSPRVFLK